MAVSIGLAVTNNLSLFPEQQVDIHRGGQRERLDLRLGEPADRVVLVFGRVPHIPGPIVHQPAREFDVYLLQDRAGWPPLLVLRRAFIPFIVVLPAPKYARSEFERRFLLDRLPAGVSDPVRIRDHYLHGTHLRLRLVEDMEGNVLKRKLVHKTRLDTDDPRLVLHTSLYLDEQEFALLSGLPGDHLVKVRYRTNVSGVVVDVIEVPDSGVAILEVSFPDRVSLALFRPPSYVGIEVTSDEGHTGRGLARPISPAVRSIPVREETDTDRPGS